MKMIQQTIVVTTLLMAALSLLPRLMVQGFDVSVKSSSPSIKTLFPSPPAPTLSADDKTSSSKRIGSNSAFKPWPKPLVISNGDYRNEMFLEEHIGGPLYSKQKEIPKLPLPTLTQTMETLLPTVLPLAENEPEARHLKQAVQDFLKEAQYLQDKLIQRQNDEFKDSSWLQEMWQKVAYLQYRESLSTFVSYYLIVGKDKTLPNQSAFFYKKKEQQQQQHDGDVGDVIFTKGIARAAAMLVAAAETRKQVCSGEMPFESIPHNNGHEVPLCSTAFKYLFHACRIPTNDHPNKQDVVHLHDPSLYKHCIVASHGQFYAMDFCDDNQNPLPLSILEACLQHCVQLGELAEEQGLDNKMPQLGWLTHTHRDTWAKARNELLAVGGNAMKEALFKMESAAFVINLDDEEPKTISEACNIWWSHSGDKAAANRWMDKSCQIACTKDGQVAYIGEHSMLDAAPTIPLIRRILRTTYKKLSASKCCHDEPSRPIGPESTAADDGADHGDDVEAITSAAATVSNIFAPVWSSSPETLKTAFKLSKMAKEQFTHLTNQYELSVVDFQGYGKKYLKSKSELFSSSSTSGSHLDAIIQMAMQLAAYRLYHGKKKSIATYEAALTRYYLHGRTATIRPVSPASRDFVQIMGVVPYSNMTSTAAAKMQALRLATLTLQEYQEKASNGMDVDRHLFGLSMMMNKDNDEQNDVASPRLFQDVLYQRSKHWLLSTSAFIFCPGFGPVTDDGLGIGYLVDSNSCLFTVSSRKDNNAVGPFCEHLQEALTEIGELLEEATTATTT